MKWKYHLRLYEPLYCSERPLFGMLHSAAESFAPLLDGFSYAGSYCFRLSALHLHCAPKHLHPFNLQQNSFALLHFSQDLMCRVITIVYLPCTHEGPTFISSLRWDIILFFLSVAVPIDLCNSRTCGITVSYYLERWACGSGNIKYVSFG